MGDEIDELHARIAELESELEESQRSQRMVQAKANLWDTIWKSVIEWKNFNEEGVLTDVKHANQAFKSEILKRLSYRTDKARIEEFENQLRDKQDPRLYNVNCR